MIEMAIRSRQYQSPVRRHVSALHQWDRPAWSLPIARPLFRLQKRSSILYWFAFWCFLEGGQATMLHALAGL